MLSKRGAAHTRGAAAGAAWQRSSSRRKVGRVVSRYTTHVHDISTRIPRSCPAVPGRRWRGRATLRTCALHRHPAAHAHGSLPSSFAQGVSFTTAIEPSRRSSSRAPMADAVGQASGGQRPCDPHAGHTQRAAVVMGGHTAFSTNRHEAKPRRTSNAAEAGSVDAAHGRPVTE